MYLRLLNGQLVTVEGFQVDVAMQELVHGSVPLAVELVEVGGIPPWMNWVRYQSW
jgi:hypothetical protein